MYYLLRTSSSVTFIIRNLKARAMKIELVVKLVIIIYDLIFHL